MKREDERKGEIKRSLSRSGNKRRRKKSGSSRRNRSSKQHHTRRKVRGKKEGDRCGVLISG